MRRILVAFLLVASISFAQNQPWKLSEPSEGLTAFLVPSGPGNVNWGKCGYKNAAGEWVIAPQFDWAGQFHEGYALVVVGARVQAKEIKTKWTKTGLSKERAGGRVLLFEGGRAVVIDRTGRQLMELRPPGGQLMIRTHWTYLGGWKRGREQDPVFMDKKGAVLYDLGSFSFHEGMARVFYSPSDCTYIRKSGDSLSYAFTLSVYACRDFAEGLAAVGVKYGQWGFITKDGQWALPPTYYGVSNFSEGWAAVSLQPNAGSKYIDKTGATVLPLPGSPKATFLGASAFSEGLALIARGEEKYVRTSGVEYYVHEYIDKRGETVFALPKPPGEYEMNAYPFHSGLARFEFGRTGSTVENYEWKPGYSEYVDRTGQVVFRFHAQCSDFNDGVAACWLGREDSSLGELVFDVNGNIVRREGLTKDLEKDLAQSPVMAKLGRPAGAPATARVVIRDKAEYEAYVSALNIQDLPRRAAALDEFVRKYPNSAVRIPAMEQAMTDHQGANNLARARELADTILQLDGQNVFALGVLTSLRYPAALQGDSQAVYDAGAYAERGLKALPGWRKPSTMEDGAFTKLGNQLAALFYSAAGLRALGAKDFAEARTYYEKSLSITPDNHLVLYQLGMAELESSPLEVNGFWHIVRAIQLARAQNQAAAVERMAGYGKAKYTSYHGNLEGWETLVAQANSSVPPQGFTVTHAGGQDAAVGKAAIPPGNLRAKQAVDEITGRMNATEKTQFEANLAIIAGAELESEGDLEGAIEAYQDAIAKAPDLAEAHTRLAKVLLRNSEFDAAITEFGESVRLEPKVAEHYYLRADCYRSKASYAEALADYNKALELNPNHSGAVVGRADAFLFSRQFEKAIPEYTAYLKAVPNSSLAWARRGNGYYWLHDYRKAIADYEKSMEVDPKQVFAYTDLAWLLATVPAAEFRNGPKAVQHAETAKTLGVADKGYESYVAEVLAAAYAEVGRFTEAVTMESKAISLAPKDDEGLAEMKARLALYQAHKPYHRAP